MNRDFIDPIRGERGAILVLTMLVLVAFSAVAVLHLASVQLRGKVVTERVEDASAFILAEAAAEESKLLVRRHDARLDTNKDGQIDSKDKAYSAWNVPIAGGSYDYSVLGRHLEEHDFYFRLSGGPWNRMRIAILEDGVEAAVGRIDSLPGGPEYLKLTLATDTSRHFYSVKATIERDKSGALNLWMKVGEPFEGSSTSDSDKLFVFSSSVDGLQTQAATIDLPGLLPQPAESNIPRVDGDVYEVEASGRVGNQRHNVRVVVERDSLLKYARFSGDDLAYTAGSVVQGQVYAGRDLLLGDAAVTFKKPVAVVRNVVGQGSAVFNSTLTQGAQPIRLPTAEHLGEQRDLAMQAGLYSTSSLILDLSSFDFTTQPATYDDTPLPAAFNGVVFSEDDVSVQGTLEGGRGLTIVAVDDLTITGSIYTGLSDPWSQRPVNVGLVAGDSISIHKSTPRILHVNAALFAMGTSWYGLGNTGTDHPAIEGTDLDGNGEIGGYNHKGKAEGPASERKYNQSKKLEIGVYDVDDSGFLESPDALGWNENGSVDSATWLLLIRGPIITAQAGSAGPWAAMAGSPSSPQTRSYQYDPDIRRYPPPHFPVQLDATRSLSFAERNADAALVSAAEELP